MISKKQPTGDEIRKRILAAASERFVQYGYNKTTMAEVAQDCGMSAANLYRYFDNKLDLGANLACDCLNTKRELLQATVRQTGRSAAERLHDVIMQALQYTHEQWADNPRMNEMVNAICRERMDIVEEHRRGEHQLLVELIEDGISRGEFHTDDVNGTATAIATAITAFNVPLLMPLYSLEDFRERAEGVVKLILNGLNKR